MIIYQGADNYFMYVMIMELRSSDNNHCVASAYGLFPDGNSYRYMTIRFILSITSSIEWLIR